MAQSAGINTKQYALFDDTWKLFEL
jgi:hypothetical protein